MKTYLLLATMLAAFPVSTIAADPDGTPVVVELFTSEACSSCPPADELLTALSQQHRMDGANVLVFTAGNQPILLRLRVDDGHGWVNHDGPVAGFDWLFHPMNRGQPKSW